MENCLSVGAGKSICSSANKTITNSAVGYVQTTTCVHVARAAKKHNQFTSNFKLEVQVQLCALHSNVDKNKDVVMRSWSIVQWFSVSTRALKDGKMIVYASIYFFSECVASMSRTKVLLF